MNMCATLRPVRTAVKSCPGTPPWAGSRGFQASSPPGEEVVLCAADASSNGTVAASAPREESTLTLAGSIANQSQDHASIAAESGGLGDPAAAAEGERREAKEVLSRLLVSKQKELLRLQLQAKAQQLAQLRGRLHDGTPAPMGKCAGVSPPTSTSCASNAPLIPPANDSPGAHGRVGQSGKSDLRKQEERIREQRDRLAAAIAAKRRQLSGAQVVVNSGDGPSMKSTKYAPPGRPTSNAGTGENSVVLATSSTSRKRPAEINSSSASSGQTPRFRARDAIVPAVSVDADGAPRVCLVDVVDVSANALDAGFGQVAEASHEREVHVDNNVPSCVSDAILIDDSDIECGPVSGQGGISQAEVDMQQSLRAQCSRNRSRSHSRSLSAGGASDDSEAQRRWRVEEALWRQGLVSTKDQE
eukprot:CAMPEP_0172867604 /NCGR_PEP_ID=MMETSP1075-20121228/84060_1 /TAXON_ID=2916 /ORGANISM="Ceratium fusus, Strain PA161109" /LENGTH=415 /DNA_ID=CAMNT_0013717011 /DNA_START=89 /DNA_END=1333 /DNA_ORIENTATION=+